MGKNRAGATGREDTTNSFPKSRVVMRQHFEPLWWIPFGFPRKKWIPLISYAGFPREKMRSSIYN